MSTMASRLNLNEGVSSTAYGRRVSMRISESRFRGGMDDAFGL